MKRHGHVQLFVLSILSLWGLPSWKSVATMPQASPERAQEKPPLTEGGWTKFASNPVIGGKLGTCFDISVLKERSAYRMWLSWRPKQSIALLQSTDGFSWPGEPVIVLGPENSTGWENDVNRPVVLKHGGLYHMWYTGQNSTNSCIGYATSTNGLVWRRMSQKPVLAAESAWEKAALMCPHVIWDQDTGSYKMWYSGGEQYEPDAIGYATSKDGIHWTRYSQNPVFKAEPAHSWEQAKVTAAQVERYGDWYLMFYIGFRDVDHAQIGVARSKDGISNWERLPANPIIRPGKGEWDADACYKPFAIFDGNKWLLWYNGRHGSLEQIGLAVHPGFDLGFK